MFAYIICCYFQQSFSVICFASFRSETGDLRDSLIVAKTSNDQLSYHNLTGNVAVHPDCNKASPRYWAILKVSCKTQDVGSQSINSQVMSIEGVLTYHSCRTVSAVDVLNLLSHI